MLKLLRCEFAKLKRKPLFFAAAAISALIPLGCALFLPEMQEFSSGAEAVDRLMSTLFQLSAYLLLMPAVVVLASNLLFEEQDNDTLKNLMTVPVSKPALALAKMTLLFLFSIAFMAVGGLVNLAIVLASGLEQAGLAVLHDATQHDNPAYTGAYIRSTETIKSYQKNYPGLRVLLDIHRDAILYSDTSIAKTVAVINGKKAAQLMIIAPYDDGTLDLPSWRENFRFAAALAAAIEEKYPGLCRPIFFCSRSYNYACSDGALLLEFGTNGNTMEEAQYTAELIAPVIAEVISGRAE